jgi:hypothetical protein
MTEYWPKVIQAVPADDCSVYAYFSDGSIHLMEVGYLIKPGTVFEPLANPTVFRDKLTVINDTVAWDIGGNRDPEKCVDLDPFVVYQAPTIADPLQKVEPA